MDCFELVMQQRALDQERELGLVVREPFPIREGRTEVLLWRWDEYCDLDRRPCRSDPVRTLAQLTRIALPASYAVEDDRVKLTQQPDAQWEGMEAFEPCLHRPDVPVGPIRHSPLLCSETFKSPAIVRGARYASSVARFVPVHTRH